MRVLSFAVNRVCERIGWAVVSLIALTALNGWAQVTTGTIFGVARDQTGAIIPGVSVTARNEGTGLVRDLITSENGAFQFSALPLGSYSVTAEVPGFQTFVRNNIVLDVNQNFRVDVVLAVGAMTDQVS